MGHPSQISKATAEVLALVRARKPGATVCPSEVARALTTTEGGAGDWRDHMTAVHKAVDRLVSEGRFG